jgi:hypothetical protein
MKITGYTKLLAHHHTGKIRHHKHTSYGSLALILLLTFIPVLVASRTVASAATDGSGAYDTYAVVPAPKPGAPTISNLVSGQTFSSSDPVNVQGSCPTKTLVKVFKNEILAGAALCQNGSYQMSIDLFVGNNSLVARAYNANDVAGPDSPIISVQLTLPGSTLNGSSLLNTTGAPAGQFYITSEQFYRGANVGDTMTWQLIIAGGTSPYAVNVSWGDGKSDLISRTDAGRFAINHVYTKPAGSNGSYTVIVKATDKAGEESYIQLVAIVSGDSQTIGVVGGISGGYTKSTIIRVTWQVLVVLILITFSFWLGEKREAWIMKRHQYGV